MGYAAVGEDLPYWALATLFKVAGLVVKLTFGPNEPVSSSLETGKPAVLGRACSPERVCF